MARRLGREFAYHFRVEPVLWEREPLTAAQHFQDQITPPRETDIVVVILWSRLGVPLPTDKFLGPLTGKPVTGTEWEFEDALKGNRERELPDLLMYRKRTPVSGSFEDEEAVRQQLAQKRLVEAFIKSWFIDQNAQSFTAAFREFTDAAAFEELLETHLRELLRKRLARPDDELVPAGVRWHQGSPFRGLLSFELEHAPVFSAAPGRAMSCASYCRAKWRAARPLCWWLAPAAPANRRWSKPDCSPISSCKAWWGRSPWCGTGGISALGRQHRSVGGVGRRHHVADGAAGAGCAAMRPSDLEGAAARRPGPGQAADQARAGGSRPAAGLTEIAEARLVVIVDQLEELFTLDAVDGARP